MAVTAVLPPSVFDSFNARALEPRLVARTFVPPEHYAQLCKRRHTVIVGPRGSGKTTLLKMLQSAALESWHHADADAYRRSVEFTGVFVPTDRNWSEQLAALGANLAEEHARLLVNAAFTTHVLRALATAINYRVHAPADSSLRPHRRVVMTEEQERSTTEQIGAAWRLPHPSARFIELKHQLSSRLLDIREIAGAERLGTNESGRGERLAHIKFLHLHFVQAVSFAIELFNDSIGDSDGRWALLFDELELAPAWLRVDLMRSLRSVDERILFKLSMSPYSGGSVESELSTAAKAGEDYDAISLWYPHKEAGYQFCRHLLSAMLADRDLPQIEPEAVFGRGEFETSPEEWREHGTAYRAGTRLHTRFKRLSESDESFAAYLSSRGISTEALESIQGDARAAELRKMSAIVAVRGTYRSGGTSKIKARQTRQRIRSRKNPPLYAGATSLFAIVEGNPRLFIGIVSSLLDRARADTLPISPSRQGAEVSRAVSRFRSLLKTIPAPLPRGGQAPRGLLTIMDAIGEYFFEEVVLGEFDPEPLGTITIHATASHELLESLGKAVNAGALIYVPGDGSELLLESLRGRRFRLSYLLAPYYGLPLQLGRPISLATVLGVPSDGGTHVQQQQPSLILPGEETNEN